MTNRTALLPSIPHGVPIASRHRIANEIRSTRRTSTARTSIIAAAAALFATLAAPAFADTLKPLEAATFKVGSEHAVGYFTSEHGHCNLVVTRAGEPDGSFTVNRYENSISPGQSANYEGSADFTCAADARSMEFDQHIQLTDKQ